jgi:2-polyprenyl-3-methyl-5-hydroxy-6-metoxy-1,4-benzoquinol methylase
MTSTVSPQVESRARKSRGTSNQDILEMVLRALTKRQISGDYIADIGCGQGDLYSYVRTRFSRYIGVDAVRYEDFPEEASFSLLDLDTGRIPLAEGSADVVAAVEVIEHLENPRDFMRKLAAIAKPGGWVIVSTPNQLSLLSLLTLLVKQRFQAFQDIHYPAHLTALLAVDLRRIANECGLTNIDIEYTLAGRIPGTGQHYPRFLSRWFPRALSENVMVIGQKGHGSKANA